jgi:hypothetical protein
VRGFPKSGSARLGSQKDGLPSRSRVLMKYRVQGCQRAHRGGAAWSLPLQIGTVGILVLLAALSLVCTAFAWAVVHAVFSSVFAALAAVAVLGITPRERN